MEEWRVGKERGEKERIEEGKEKDENERIEE